MDEDLNRNPWKTIKTSTVYDNKWIRVEHNEVLTPAGTEGIYGVVRYKNLAIGIVPIDNEGYTWLVGQFRYPQEKYSWEIPEGGGPIGIDPLDSAKRELLEECGLTATTWKELMRMDLSNSVTDELAIIYTAKDLMSGEAMPEETEELRLWRLPLVEAVAMALRGEITDSMSVAALLRVALVEDIV